jgi:hypothetical protein
VLFSDSRSLFYIRARAEADEIAMGIPSVAANVMPRESSNMSPFETAIPVRDGFEHCIGRAPNKNLLSRVLASSVFRINAINPEAL